MSGHQLTPEALERLAQIVEEYQLQELLEMMEAVVRVGRGYGRIEITFTNGSISDLSGTFTRKPRVDQTGLLKPGGRK